MEIKSCQFKEKNDVCKYLLITNFCLSKYNFKIVKISAKLMKIFITCILIITLDPIPVKNHPQTHKIKRQIATQKNKRD